MKLQTICDELRSFQRERSVVLKSRNMQENRLRAVIAGTLGYHSRMPDAERKKKFKDAADHIKAVSKMPANAELQGFDRIIKATLFGIDALNMLKESLEESMVCLAEELPIASWVREPEQRGFGMLSLAKIIGEAGDLAFRGEYTRNEEKRIDVPVGFPNPGKLWKRFGCAPHTFAGKTLMGSTWKAGKEGKLTGEEWEAFGYCPRRRSLMWNVSDNIVKQNGEGPYRQRYDEAKASCQENHPEYSKQRCHLHGMLLASKLLLKNLLIEWCRLEGVKLQSKEYKSAIAAV